ncbi:MAG: AAA family ATPase [Candidatus Methanomethylicus sp.]|nr:AAA family ATPase [Candidatus Methanomethylicus sp.]
MSSPIRILKPNNEAEKEIIKVRILERGLFLSEDEQNALLTAISKGARKVKLNNKHVEVISSPSPDYDKRNPIFVPDLSYDLPQELESLVPINIPTYFDFKNLWQKLLIVLQVTGQTVLIGEKGVGKNHLCSAIAQENSLPLYDISGSRNLTEYDLVGHYEMSEGRTCWVDGLLPFWCKNGGLLMLDEISLARSSVLARIHSIFDFRRYLVVKEHQNERIDRHPHAYAVVALNPPKGEYLGTQHLNIAFLDRFQVISVPELSFEEKKRIIQERTCLSNDAFIDSLLDVADRINSEYKQGNFRDFVGLRNLIDCCNLIENGLSKKEAIEISIINRFSDEEEMSRVEEISSILVE